MDDKEQQGIYSAGASEIFWKNFLAGFSRGLGGLFVYLLFLIVLGVIFINFTLPKLMPMITSYSNLLKTFESVSNPQNLLGK